VITGQDVAALLERHRFDFFAGVPCSLVEDVIAVLEQGSRAGYHPSSDPHPVGDIQHAPLKASVGAESVMKQRAPDRITQISIDTGCKLSIDRSTDRMPLNDPPLGDQVRMETPHAIGIGGGSTGHGQLQGHEVHEMHRPVLFEEPPERLLMTKMERIVQRLSFRPLCRHGFPPMVPCVRCRAG
jgi:hypothetical protein